MYLINNKCKKLKVLLVKSGKDQWKLHDNSWERFIKFSGYEEITLLHFLNESADTYYVTGYDAQGMEVSGYGTLNTQGRLGKCTAVVPESRRMSGTLYVAYLVICLYEVF